MFGILWLSLKRERERERGNNSPKLAPSLSIFRDEDPIMSPKRTRKEGIGKPCVNLTPKRNLTDFLNVVNSCIKKVCHNLFASLMIDWWSKIG